MAEYSLKHRASGARLRRSCYAALAVLALVLGDSDPRAQAPPTSDTTNTSSTPMKSFVFLFRQSSPLSETEQKRRAEEVRAWALRLNEQGHKLDPRMLGEEKQRIGPNGKSTATGQTEDGSLTAILFVEARDFADAVRIAESHPALRYGVISVEVRPWTTPLAPPASPPQARPADNSAK